MQGHLLLVGQLGRLEGHFLGRSPVNLAARYRLYGSSGGRGGDERKEKEEAVHFDKGEFITILMTSCQEYLTRGSL